MDGRHFDTITRGLTAGVARRQAVGGLLGGALSLLTGASVLEARKRGKGRKKGKGKGKGRTKVTFCHRTESGEFNLITVGAPATKAHRKHGDVLCEAGACQTVANGCAEDGSCTFDLAEEGAVCEIDGVAGTCDAEGTCVPDETEPPVEE